MSGQPENQDGESLTIDPEQLRFIRSLRSEWSWCEAGAPRMTLFAPGSDASLMAARVREVTGPWLVSDETMLLSAYRRGMLAATAFVGHAELAAGSFEYESPFTPSRLEEEPFVKSPRVEIRGSTIRMDVTSEHLALLKAANVRFFDDGGWQCEAAIDPKRPYGDMSFFYIDMVRALGLDTDPLPPSEDDEWSKERLAWLDDLHLTLQPALQILLRRGELPRTTFRRTAYGPWE
jgi:hypothetical protein